MISWNSAAQPMPPEIVRVIGFPTFSECADAVPVVVAAYDHGPCCLGNVFRFVSHGQCAQYRYKIVPVRRDQNWYPAGWGIMQVKTELIGAFEDETRGLGYFSRLNPLSRGGTVGACLADAFFYWE